MTTEIRLTRAGDPDPHFVVDVDGYLRALRALMSLHDVDADRLLTSVGRSGLSTLSSLDLHHLLFGDNQELPPRELVNFVTNVCGLTGGESLRWEKACLDIQLSGDSRPAGRVHPTLRTPGFAPTILDAEYRWRVLFAYLYAASGCPWIAGYPRAKVQDRFAGYGGSIDAPFATAMLAAYDTASAATIPDPAVFNALLRRDSCAVLSWEVETFDPQEKARRILENMLSLPEGPRTLDAEGLVVGTNGAPAMEIRLPDGSVLLLDCSYPVGDSLAAQALERLLPLLKPSLSSLCPAKPKPDTALDAAGFVQLMIELKTWTGMSLRQLSDAAKAQDNWNLPHSSLGDALRTPMLPRRELLWAFTGAAGLSGPERDLWVEVRDRLEKESPAPAPRAVADDEPEDADQSEPGQVLGSDGSDRQDEAPEHDDARDRDTPETLYDVLATFRQRLAHQCGYRGLCVEGVTEEQAEASRHQEGRARVAGVASAYGREKLAEGVILHLERMRGRTRRRLSTDLVTLVGATTVSLVEGCYRVPESDLDPEVERQRRGVIEYQLTRTTDPRTGHYQSAAEYGLLGIVSVSANDPVNHRNYVQQVIELLDAMGSWVSPTRRWWKRLSG